MGQEDKQTGKIKFKKLAATSTMDKYMMTKAMDKDNPITQSKKMQTNSNKTKQKKKLRGWTIGEWNVRGLNGKEEELLQEFEDQGLNLLALTETKKKGQKTIELEKGHLLILSGVKTEERAQAGVGCIVNNNIKKYLNNYDCISERILKLEFEIKKGDKLLVIILYGPDENDSVSKRWLLDNCQHRSWK